MANQRFIYIVFRGSKWSKPQTRKQDAVKIARHCPVSEIHHTTRIMVMPVRDFNSQSWDYPTFLQCATEYTGVW